MNAPMMHVAVDLGLQRIASHVLDDFLPQEIDLYLNRAQRAFVAANRQALMAEGPNYIAAQENLKPLLKSEDLGAGEDHPYYERAYSVGVPEDFAYFIGARLLFGNKSKRTEIVTPEEFDRSVETATDEPLFTIAPVTLTNDRLLVLTDVQDPEALTVGLTYVRNPVSIKLDTTGGGANVNCELPEQTHQDIVDMAVSLMLNDLTAGQPQKQ